MSLATFLALAATLGLRHAFEPDHMAAVSTLVTRKGGAREAATMGAAWGLGHSLALLAVASVLALAKASLPEVVTAAFEAAVGIMLLVLGARGVLRAARDGRAAPQRVHRHGAFEHAHELPSGGHLHVGGRVFALRSLLIGLVHGLAGSGSLTALIAAEVPSASGRLAYVAAFGLGSIVGMAALSGLAGLTLARVARRDVWRRAVEGAAGAVAVVVGVLWCSAQVADLVR